MQSTYHTYISRVVLGVFTLALVVGPAEAIDLRSWDRKIDNANKRFRVVLPRFHEEVVLEEEAAAGE